MDDRSLSAHALGERMAAALHAIAGVRVVVCGDLLLDEYIWGEAERISPEAPVPVVRVTRQEVRLGGAANVARNVAALGGVPCLLGVVGNDETGTAIMSLWADHGQGETSILTDTERITPRKTRYLAGNQQMLRVDREASPAVTTTREAGMAAWLEAIQQKTPCASVCFSDYQKGTLSASGMEAYRAVLQGQWPILANPKPASAGWFGGASLITLNRSEAQGLLPVAERGRALDEVGGELRSQLGVERLLITQGGNGMTLFEAAGHLHVPAVETAVFDVTGAGDTVLAALTLAAGAGLPWEDACLLASYAAAVVVRKVGVAAAEPSEVMALAEREPLTPVWYRNSGP
ncbi:MAG: bifunctional ADP-heptose synthase [bacterium]